VFQYQELMNTTLHSYKLLRSTGYMSQTVYKGKTEARSGVAITHKQISVNYVCEETNNY